MTNFLARTIDLFTQLTELTIEIPSHLELKIQLLKEDFEFSLNSYFAKDAVKNSKIIKKTEKFTNDYYAVKIYQILKQLYQLRPENSRKIIRLMVQIQNQIPFSLNHQDEFKNPYPQFLLFSQQYHSPHFSSKSQRAGISGTPLDEIIDQLKTEELSPDYLRVNIYFAPYGHDLKPFVYNNRTWVVFSKAGIEATRIVPMIPTQDLLNRIKKIPAVHNPSVIIDETTETLTGSLKPLETRCFRR